MTGRLTLLVLALGMCAASPVFADEEVLVLNKPEAQTHDVQMIGWSKDESRYALRVYELAPEVFDPDLHKVSFCKGYVDHTGKRFRGGLWLLFYVGNRQKGQWQIQDSRTCTPPETARDRLTQAKAALAEQGI